MHVNELDPDRSEETVGAHDDNVVPSRGIRKLPTVGLGGDGYAHRAGVRTAMPGPAGPGTLALLSGSNLPPNGAPVR